MQRSIVIITLILLSFGLKAQVYQAMPQAGYGPIKRILIDSVLTIPIGINSLSNITGGRDAAQIRWNTTDSGFYVYSGYQWIKINIDSVSLSNRINAKLNISDTAAMLSPYMKKIDTISLSNRIDVRVKYSDTTAMLNPYLRKLDTASLSNRINKKQDKITLTTTGTNGISTLSGDTLNIPNYGGALTGYVPYVGATTDVNLDFRNLTGGFLFAKSALKVSDLNAGTGGTNDYTSIQTTNTDFLFFTQKVISGLTYRNVAKFKYATPNVNYVNDYDYNLPVRNGTLALVEDTVSLSNRINAIIPTDTTSLSDRINLRVKYSDTASMLSPYLRKADTSSLSNRIDLRVKYSDTAAMLNPYLRKVDTASLSNRINLRVKYSDTAAMLSPYLKTAVRSVGISMPSAFSVANSPITNTGTIAITGAGNTSQYIDGTGALQTMSGIVTEVETLVKEVYNETGATLTKGTVVYINGGHGNLPTVTKAVSTLDSLSAQTFGLIKADISHNSNGYVTVIGDLIDMPTNAYPNGTQLYLSTTAGTYTSTKQYAPSHLVYVGIVTRSHPTQGVISVKIQNGYEMDELHNVAAQSPSNNSLLQYKTATSLWTKVDGTTTNIAEGTNLYYTDARVSNKMNYTDTVSLSNRINLKADILSGTTNTIPKFNSSTTIGNSNIKDNGNAVSISTTAGANGALQVGDYNGGIMINKGSSGASLIFKNTLSSNKLWDINPVANDLTIEESNVGSPRIFLKAGGNVGISTITPTKTLDVDGTFKVSDTATFGNKLSNGTYTYTLPSNNGTLALTSDVAVDTTSLSNRINLKVTSVSGTSPIVSSGGITPAISIPAATTSVNGYLTSTNWNTFNGKMDLSDTASLSNRINAKGSVSSVGTGLGLTGGTIVTTGTLLVDTSSASILSRQRAANTYATTSALSGYLPLTGGILSGTLTGTTAIFSANVLASGDVGIGTSSPSYKLDVSGTGRFTDTLSLIKSGNALLKVHASTNTTPVADIELMRGTGTTWGDDAYGDYRFRDSVGKLLVQYAESGVPSSRLTIESTGEVGIGTITPAKLLTVNTPATTSNGIGIYKNGTQTGFLGDGGSATALGMFQLYNTGTESVRIYSGGTSWINGGNLGIGTTTIGSKLQVNGNAAIGYSASTAAPSNGLAVSGAVSIGQTANAAQIDILSTGTVLQAAGSGIGNTTFVLKNTAATFNNSLFYGVTTNTGSGFKLLDLRTNNGSNAVFNVDGTGALAGTGATFSSRVNINGAVDDGSTALRVAGNVSLTTAGNKLNIATGTNASVGLATLVGGTVTVSTTAVTSNSGIMLTCRTVGGTQGMLRISAITGGTSFVITSSSATDTSQISWLIIN